MKTDHISLASKSSCNEFLPSDPLRHRHRNRGALGARAPPRFCNKQRSVLFMFRKCPLFLKKKVPLKCRVPPSLRCFLRPCPAVFKLFQHHVNASSNFGTVTFFMAFRKCQHPMNAVSDSFSGYLKGLVSWLCSMPRQLFNWQLKKQPKLCFEFCVA